jgi:long-chain acyl-CoA synthetase
VRIGQRQAGPPLVAEPLEQLTTLAAEHPHRPAFAESGEVTGWAEFAARVGGWTRELAEGPPFLGLMAESGIDWAAIELAAEFAGVCFVPLPAFFSDDQLSRISTETASIRFIADAAHLNRAQRLLPGAEPMGDPRGPLPDTSRGGGRLIFTSGSTGAPKGVQLSPRQIAASTTAIAAASGACVSDIHLSLLPLPLLLEQIAAIRVPLLVGIPTIFDPLPFPAATGDAIAARFAEHRPTTAVLVPELLALWVGALERSGERAPDELRFVAVGGAHLPDGLAARAVALGIPVHEGYGLTECCSVVTVNRPGQLRTGTAGAPVPGVEVRIEDGEIVVYGPTVMDGYLGGRAADGTWRTGDLGQIDADGNLTLLGRRDNLIVTAMGRNVSPEWVEATLLSERALAFCVIADTGEAQPAALIIPHPGVSADAARIAARRAADALPFYARPGRVETASREALVQNELLSPNGRPRRQAIAAWLRAHPQSTKEPSPRCRLSTTG